MVSSIDDTEQPLAVWVPPDYSPRRKISADCRAARSDADHRMIPSPVSHSRARLSEGRDFAQSVCAVTWLSGPGETDFWEADHWDQGALFH